MKDFIIKRLETDLEFAILLPLIIRFSAETETPLWKNILEVCSTFTDPDTITTIQLEGDRVTGYLCGFPVNRNDFLLSQGFNSNPKLSHQGMAFFKREVRKGGHDTLIMVSSLPQKVMEKHGFKLYRKMYTKRLNDERERLPQIV